MSIATRQPRVFISRTNAEKPINLPNTSLGPLFKGHDEFLAELRQHLSPPKALV